MSETFSIIVAQWIGSVPLRAPTADGSANQVIKTDGSGNLSFVTIASGITIDSTAITSGAATRILFENASNQVSSSANFTYDASGNVGIGVTSPGSYDTLADDLVVGKATDAGITIATTGGASNSGSLFFADVNSDFSGAIWYKHSDDKMHFASSWSGSGASSDITIDGPNHRVGINNQSPGAQLEVTAADATTIGQIVEAAAAQSANLFEINTNGGSGGDILLVNSLGLKIQTSGTFDLDVEGGARLGHDPNHGLWVGHHASANITALQIWPGQSTEAAVNITAYSENGSNVNIPLNINAKGSGVITLGGTSTGGTVAGGTFAVSGAGAAEIPLSVEAAAAQSANLVEINSNGGSGGDIFNISAGGDVEIPQGKNLYLYKAWNCSITAVNQNVQIYSLGTHALNILGGQIRVINSSVFGWSSSADNSTTTDTAIARHSSGAIAITDGGVHTSSTPAASTLTGQGGSGANVAGATLNIASSQGTGTGVGGDLVFQYAAAGASSSTPNSLATAMTIDGGTGSVDIGGTLTGAPLRVKCDANDQGILFEENSGTESYRIGVAGDGSLHFYNSGTVNIALTVMDTNLIGINNTSPGAQLDIVSKDATTVGFKVELAATPTANALEINSNGGSGGDILNVSSVGALNTTIVRSPEIGVINATEGGTANLARKTAHETHTLAAAGTSDTTTISIPSGARLLGVSFNVNTAVSDDGGDDTWSAAFVTGSTTTLATAAAAAQNTKVDLMLPDEISTGVCQIRFTANGGSFDAGVIEIVAYYEELTSLANV